MVDYSVNPLAVDTYARTMAMAFDEKSIVSVPTGFLAFFGRPETNSQTLFSPDSEVVDIDIIRANQRTAALVPRGTNARHIGTTQENAEVTRWTNFNRVYPLIVEESDIEAGQLLKRLPGDSPYMVKARRQRLQTLALRAHQEQVRRTVRLMELLASKSILTGKMPAILGTSDPDLEYNFRRNTNLSITLGTQWTTVTADGLGDIDDAADKIQEYGLEQADSMFCGATAFEAFLKLTDVIAKADNRRFELILVSDRNPVPARYNRFIDAGWTARGRLRTPRGREIWMFTYLAGYTNSGGTFTRYMPDGKVVICYSGARADRYFGPPELLPDIPMRQQFYQQLFGFDISMPNMPPNIKNAGAAVSPGMFYFDAYAPESWQRVTVRMQAAPIYATTQTDVYAVIENAA